MSVTCESGLKPPKCAGQNVSSLHGDVIKIFLTFYFCCPIPRVLRCAVFQNSIPSSLLPRKLQRRWSYHRLLAGSGVSTPGAIVLGTILSKAAVPASVTKSCVIGKIYLLEIFGDLSIGVLFLSNVHELRLGEIKYEENSPQGRLYRSLWVI